MPLAKLTEFANDYISHQEAHKPFSPYWKVNMRSTDTKMTRISPPRAPKGYLMAMIDEVKDEEINIDVTSRCMIIALILKFCLPHVVYAVVSVMESRTSLFCYPCGNRKCRYDFHILRSSMHRIRILSWSLRCWHGVLTKPNVWVCKMRCRMGNIISFS